MIDARDALEITDAARAVEWPGYVDSWHAPADAASGGTGVPK
jgi:homogentisate 1,2-dioxygenase